MKKSEIDFGTIMMIYNTLNRLMAMEDYETLAKSYKIYDIRIRECLSKHAPLHRNLKRVEFVDLCERDLKSEDYIKNRIRKMITLFEILVSFDKNYSEVLYNRSVKE